jgi:FkbM family methyltransferase
MIEKLIHDLANLRRLMGLGSMLSYCWALLVNLPKLFGERNIQAADKYFGRKGHLAFWIGSEARITLPGEYFSGVREMYGRRVYFAEPGFDVQPGDVTIDLGANVGLFSLYSAKLGASKTVAVEAQAEFVQRIGDNFALNACADKLVAINALVGAQSGVFSQSDTAHDDRLKQATLLTMQDLFDQYSLERCDFLKIDIEGSEFALFKENHTWLARVHKIAMEVHNQFGDEKSLVQVLAQYGFRTRLRNNSLQPVNGLDGNDGYLFATNPAQAREPCTTTR